NLLAYDYRHNTIGFVGSIAYNFKDMIVRTLSRSGVRVGAVLKSPIDELVKYHIQNG
ncbi:MAG: ATPase, partial [Bacteroidales bacterium]|nr:ATPase [Bacteroidales bacterium]